MTRLTRRLLIAAAGLAGICVLLMIAGITVARSAWFRDEVRQRIIREVESATGGRAEIGAFSFDWSRLRAEVRSFVLHGAEGPGEPPLFSASSVQVGLRVISALRREVDIADFTVVEPRVRIVIYEDGRSNLPQPEAARAGRHPVEQVLGLAIKRFEVRQGLVEIDQRQFPLNVRGENLSARWFYRADGPSYAGEVSFRKLNLSSPSYMPTALDADLSLALANNQLVVQEARLATGRSSAKVTGKVTNLAAPRMSLSLDARLSLPELISFAKVKAVGGGTLAVTGDLAFAGRSDFALKAKVKGSGLSARVEGAEIKGLNLSAAVALDPQELELDRLSISALGGTFSGSAGFNRSGRLRVAGDLREIPLDGLAALRGMPPPWRGLASGAIELIGIWAGGALHGVKLTGRVGITPADAVKPISGFVDMTLDQGAGTLTFGDSHLATAASRASFTGALGQRLRVELETSNLEDLLPAAAYLNGGATPRLPIALRNGIARFSGTVTGGLNDPRAAGRLSLTNFTYESRLFDRLEADGAVSRRGVEAAKLTVDQAGARVEGTGRLALLDWRPDRSGRIAGSFILRGLPVSRLAAESGAKIALTGELAGSFQLGGTLGEPQITGKVTITGAEAFGRRVKQGWGQFRYASRMLSVGSFQLDWGTARLAGSAQYSHRVDDWSSGALRFRVSSKDVRLADLRVPAGIPEGLDGLVDADLKGAASAEGARLLLSEVQGNASLRKLALGGKVAGDLSLSVSTETSTALVDATGVLAGAKVKAQASCLLQGTYPVQGELSFTGFSVSSLRPWFPGGGVDQPPLEASGDGRVVFRGAGLNPESWSARLEMPAVELQPPPGVKSPVSGLRNAGLIALAINRKEIRVLGAQFAGPDTNMRITGKIDLLSRYSAYDLRIHGGINLGILRNVDPDITATGETMLDATIRGPRARPEIYGRADLKGVSLFLSGVSNGLDNVTGVVYLFRDRATIENVTAQTGGGTLKLNGFVGYAGDRLSYRLRAAIGRVRVRYPEGVSTSVDASLDLTGTSQRSLLSGTVTILRAGVAQDVDLASLLARSTLPMLTPAVQNDLLRGMQFDVRVETSPNVRIDTSLTSDVQAEAEMRLRGTPYKPVLLGRLLINQGQVNFMGNRYRISRGEVSFLNPVRLEPVVSLDLETRVRGIDVTMNFTGPMDRLNVAYRSDPPLQVQEIIALLAVGRAPTSDPTLLARQSERDQSWQQIGASTLVGQALAAPVANRLQRFFGVSRIKIDPKLTGLGNNPEAQLTLEQQISRDITFTYVTNLAQEQQQLIRVEWNISRQWSILAVREETGLFSVEFQYRKQFR
ncbi:MAG: translocation/assembly module TamB domain-containing protein [Bryobacteraceae bacterium]